MVAELLDVGERSALPSSYLCKILGISRRQLTRDIEKNVEAVLSFVRLGAAITSPKTRSSSVAISGRWKVALGSWTPLAKL